jgi:hypothetical protein
MALMVSITVNLNLVGLRLSIHTNQNPPSLAARVLDAFGPSGKIRFLKSFAPIGHGVTNSGVFLLPIGFFDSFLCRSRLDRIGFSSIVAQLPLARIESLCKASLDRS